MTMAMPDSARRLSIRPSRPAVQEERDAGVVAVKARRASAKLAKAANKAMKRAALAADAEVEVLSAAERREREGILREWWSRYVQPDASRVLKEHEYEAFYANARAFFVDHTLSFNEWQELRLAFIAAVRASKPAPSSESDYWKGRGNSNASIIIGARLDGW